jgi:hypothetical protein
VPTGQCGWRGRRAVLPPSPPQRRMTCQHRGGPWHCVQGAAGCVPRAAAEGAGQFDCKCSATGGRGRCETGMILTWWQRDIRTCGLTFWGGGCRRVLSQHGWHCLPGQGPAAIYRRESQSQTQLAAEAATRLHQIYILCSGRVVCPPVIMSVCRLPTRC